MLMLDFPFILFFLIIASGAIWLTDCLLFAKNRPKPVNGSPVKLPIILDYAKSLFSVFLIVFILRSFVAQLFVVPSGSLVPTVTPGDFLFVTQYSYGLRMPIWDKTLLKTWQPKAGDIVVIQWPTNPLVNFVKRVVAVPGDKVSYVNKVFYINGKEMKQTYLGTTQYSDTPNIPQWTVKIMRENLQGVQHNIYVCPETSYGCPGHAVQNFYNLVIPKGEYLMIGDNRDDSDDSRYWGLVPEKYLVGKAQMVIFSWNSTANWLHKVQWSRIGTRL